MIVNREDDEIAANLKQEEYTKTLDTTIEIDKKLNLGTGDDELIENVVKTAKSGMGLVGAFVPD